MTQLEARAYEAEIEPSGDGRSLHGYVAVFNSRARIPDRGGDFEEEIKPGAFDRSLRENGVPVLQWDHGKDPRVGTVPIGKWTEMRRDGKGYRVAGRLFDNPVVEPVRQAIANEAVTGLSFRFKVGKNGDRWERRHGGMDLRHVLDADVHEAGPVVFPAYAQAKVSLRDMDDDEVADAVFELRQLAGLDVYDDLDHYSERDAFGGVARDYGDEPSLAAMAEYALDYLPMDKLYESIGLNPDRALDRVEALRDRQKTERRAVLADRLSLARTERRARQAADAAFREWKAPWRLSDSWDRLLVARAAADAATAELREACLQDAEQIAALRKRVAS